MKKLIDQLEKEKILSRKDFIYLLENYDDEIRNYLAEKARNITVKQFGNKIYTRGLIEISNYCKNDCYYCGIRCSNKKVERYRLNKDDIMSCCKTGYDLGFRTFVMQGGEDNYFTDDIIVDIIKSIKDLYSDCAITLSLGEKSYESYFRYFQAGADRYLLRHETACEDHYKKLHPHILSLKNRKECLFNLKKIGYQTGTGFMVGSPYQTAENIVEDLYFIKELSPEMIGIGPFIPHVDTPFGNKNSGEMNLTLLLISILRLMIPNSMIPTTTALGTIHPNGREEGILAGANVVMPNLSPISVRKKYSLYNNKICTKEEAAESRNLLQERMKKIGYELSIDKGDFKPIII
ncbi:[FeFe] hydrogenase H-cluster radical SAM maturase HydE [Anaerovorax odorimutans]|uniref:[FeFe] hydrogenase H-cluster radical SAM maturase HydE n=1 Tax=Anaerovorax odorimutans TaxID=109327 RepID=UPI0004128461|nr:[FeFe] hydrogenase H-cluster radical SAM maturase HydE [Anaerovorax odorimutans]